MEKVDVAVVGAGLAGLAAAWVLAAEGLEVLVVERGDYPGSKNVSGGRLYLNPVRSLLPDLWDDAIFERPVTCERLSIMSPRASATIELSSDRLRQPPYQSYTVLRSKLDRWFAERVAERGAMIVPRFVVDDLAIEKGRVVGIQAGQDRIAADVVVAADGALSLLAEKAGLRGSHHPAHFAVGIKEVIELPAELIEQRFHLQPGHGTAQLFFGAITHGVTGGAFLYTNRDSISLGLVTSIRGLIERDVPIETAPLLEQFKQRPEIDVLIRGGQLLEYSAHVIPERGLNARPRLVGDGILVTGDAAGLALNLGLTVRGMDYALASGVFAAQAILEARRAGDYSAASLARYERLLRQSFVRQDHRTFRHMGRLLQNRRLLDQHPATICGILEELMSVREGPKQKLSATVLSAMCSRAGLSLLRDLCAFRKV